MKKNIVKTILAIIISLFVTINIQSQDAYTAEDRGDEILQRFDDRFRLMDSIILRVPGEGLNPVMVDTAVFNLSKFGRVDAIDNSVKAEISAVKSVTGVDIRGQVYGRPGRQVSYDPEDPLVAYNAKVQAEIEWNIFHSSIYKRAAKIKELQLKGELRQLDYATDDLQEAILQQKQKLRFRHYSQLLSVINLHVDNVRLLTETQVYLLEQGKISGEDLLKLINEQSELERQLISIKADSIINELPAPRSIAYIERVDTAGFFKSLKDNNIELKKLGIQFEILDAQREKIDYLQTMDILPFVRYSYYNRENVHNTYNVDVGVSFKIPLSSEVSKKKKALMAEQEVVDYERTLLEKESYKNLILAFHDLTIYNENIKGEYQRMKTLEKFLEMRTNSYENVDGEYNRINRLQEYNSYLQAWERLLEFTYQRDQILLNLQSYMLAEPISKYIEFTEIDSVI